LRHWGQQVAGFLEHTPGSLDVHSDWREDAYRMKVNLRGEVANRLGFTNATIGRELAGGFEGAPVTTYWKGERDIAVALRLKHVHGQLRDAVSDMKEELAELCGLPVDTELQLSLLDGSGSAPTPDTEGAVGSALARNPEIEAAAHQVEKARAALGAARGEYIPDISAFAQ
jgi:hypothetical protein